MCGAFAKRSTPEEGSNDRWPEELCAAPAADRRVLLVWEGFVRLFQIPLFILPTPSNVFVALYRGFASSLYIDHIWITITETLLGFVLGTSLAFLLGTVIALSRPVEYFLYPFVVMFQAMPKVALAPLIIVWFGLGLTSKVVNAALVAFFR